jgi:hypothetical protein
MLGIAVSFDEEKKDLLTKNILLLSDLNSVSVTFVANVEQLVLF